MCLSISRWVTELHRHGLSFRWNSRKLTPNNFYGLASLDKGQWWMLRYARGKNVFVGEKRKTTTTKWIASFLLRQTQSLFTLFAKRSSGLVRYLWKWFILFLHGFCIWEPRTNINIFFCISWWNMLLLVENAGVNSTKECKIFAGGYVVFK